MKPEQSHQPTHQPSPEPHEQTEEWFERWFRNELYLKLYAHRDRAEATHCVELILRATAAAGHVPSHALDLACGPGRHSITLAQRGLQVTAVDLSPTLLGHALTAAAKEGVEDHIRFLRSDMRHITFHQEFDLAVQLFTSFGYFDSPADDFLVLERVRQALRPGGYYALDVLNEQQLRSSLLNSSRKWVDDLEVVEHRQIVDDRVEKTITIHAGAEQMEFHESVRLYPPDTLAQMLNDAGLVPVEWFGDYHGSAFHPRHSARMLVIARAE